MKPLLVAFLAVGIGVAALASVPATAAEKDYLIVSRGQGSGSTAIDDRIAASGGVRQGTLGGSRAGARGPSATLPSSRQVAMDPRVHGIAEDIEVPWLPAEAVQAAAVDPDEAGLNSEPSSPPTSGTCAESVPIDGRRDIGAAARGWRSSTPDSGASTPTWRRTSTSASAAPSSPQSRASTRSSNGFNHGTHVAGIIAAPINNMGIQGVAPQAEIVGRQGAAQRQRHRQLQLDHPGNPVRDQHPGGCGQHEPWDDVRSHQPGRGRRGAAGRGAQPRDQPRTARACSVVCAAGNEGVDLNSRLWSIPAQSGGGFAVSATAPMRREGLRHARLLHQLRAVGRQRGCSGRRPHRGRRARGHDPRARWARPR